MLVVLVVYFGDLILGFFVGGESGEGGGVVGSMMVGEGVISAVCGWRWCLTVVGAVFCSVWMASGGVSFFGVAVDVQASIRSSVWLQLCTGEATGPELSPSRRTFSKVESRQSCTLVMH